MVDLAIRRDRGLEKPQNIERTQQKSKIKKTLKFHKEYAQVLREEHSVLSISRRHIGSVFILKQILTTLAVGAMLQSMNKYNIPRPRPRQI